MKLKIEEWIKNNCLSEDACEIFKESVVCYKVGIYRAAYIMAYLGFEVEVKYRLINSKVKPTNLNESEWEAKKDLLNHPQKWEDELFSTICTLPPAPNKEDKRVFMFIKATEIKTCWEYYRIKRNECVHYRDDIINSSTVENLWDFIIKRSQQFYVNGGESYLLTSIVESFNRLKSDEKESYSSEIEQLNLLLDQESICRFLCELDKEYEKLDRKAIVENYILFQKSLTLSQYENIKNGFHKYLKEDNICDKVEFLYNNKIEYITTYLKNDVEFKKCVWDTYIRKFKCYDEDIWGMAIIYNEFDLLYKQEWDIFSGVLLKTPNIEYRLQDIENKIVTMLSEKGFFEKLKVQVDSINFTDWNTANRNEYFLFPRIRYCDINQKVYQNVVYLLKQRSSGTTIYDGILSEFDLPNVKDGFLNYEKVNDINELSAYMGW